MNSDTNVAASFRIIMKLAAELVPKFSNMTSIPDQEFFDSLQEIQKVAKEAMVRAEKLEVGE